MSYPSLQIDKKMVATMQKVSTAAWVGYSGEDKAKLFGGGGCIMPSLLANEYNRYTYARSAPRHRHHEQKKRETFVSLFSTQSRGRTGTGVNLLVFETSASTDSAIWASDFSEMVCKYRNYFLTDKIFKNFFSNSLHFVIFLAIATTSEGP